MTDRLDSQIRDLVARAVDDAPPPPDLDDAIAGRSMQFRSAPRRRPARAWTVAGAVGLTAAAAVIGIVALGGGTDDARQRIVPATEPPVVTDPDAVPVPDPAVTTTMAPPAPAPGTVPDPVQTTEPPSSGGPVVAAGRPVEVVAGPGGVTITEQGASATTITTEPMANAFVAADGRVFMQPAGAVSAPDAATPVLVSDLDAPAVDPVPLTLPAEFAGRAITLHDVAQPGGRTVLLLEVGPTEWPCLQPEPCDATLFAFDVTDDGDFIATALAAQWVWEGGFAPMSLADDGRILGAVSNTVVVTTFTGSYPADDVPPLDPAALGLEEEYVDCSTCPTGFALDPTGRFAAWIELADDGVPMLVVHSTADGASPLSVELVGPAVDACCGTEGFGLFAGTPVVDLADVADDTAGGFVGRVAIGQAQSGADSPSLIVDLATGTIEPGPPGARVTFGLLG